MSGEYIMKIELNKTYNVSNRYKKTFIDSTFLSKENSPHLEWAIHWRVGNLLVTPMNEDEVELLQEIVDAGDDFDDVFETDDFENWELRSSWDGCYSELKCFQNPSYADELIEKFEEDEELQDEYFDLSGYAVDGLGYDYADCRITIEGAITVEEAESQNQIDTE